MDKDSRFSAKDHEKTSAIEHFNRSISDLTDLSGNADPLSQAFRHGEDFFRGYLDLLKKSNYLSFIWWIFTILIPVLLVLAIVAVNDPKSEIGYWMHELDLIFLILPCIFLFMCVYAYLYCSRNKQLQGRFFKESNEEVRFSILSRIFRIHGKYGNKQHKSFSELSKREQAEVLIIYSSIAQIACIPLFSMSILLYGIYYGLDTSSTLSIFGGAGLSFLINIVTSKCFDYQSLVEPKIQALIHSGFLHIEE